MTATQKKIRDSMSRIEGEILRSKKLIALLKKAIEQNKGDKDERDKD